MAKQPTPQGISALLRKAGFDKSVKSPSRIKGFNESSRGYRVTGRDDGGVEVEFVQSSFRMNTDQAYVDKTLKGYREAIEAAGFTVVDGTSTVRDTLIVRAVEEA